MRHYFLISGVLFSGIALKIPQAFVWGKAWIPFLLGLIMFGMGLTLTPKDFKYVWQNKRSVLIGVIAQYTLMPLLAFMLSRFFGFSDMILIGMMLVGSCPGGTASNVMVYLAKGNVALSITMTLFSTLIAPILTPAIVSLFINQIIEVPILKMMFTVFWIIILPISAGLVCRTLFKESIKPLLTFFPHLSMATIIFVIAVIMALNKHTLLTFPVMIAAAVILHNLTGIGLGYGIATLLKCSKEDKRAIAIEVGMQNSGLAVTLATQFFSSQAALPGALFSLWHNLSGSVLARFWSVKPIKNADNGT